MALICKTKLSSEPIKKSVFTFFPLNYFAKAVPNMDRQNILRGSCSMFFPLTMKILCALHHTFFLTLPNLHIPVDKAICAQLVHNNDQT